MRVGRTEPGRADSRVGVAHVVEQPAHKLARQISTKCPRRIDVAERRCHVGNLAVAHAPVGPGVGKVDLFTVDDEIHVARRDQLQAGGGDDDVGIKVFA